MIWGAVFIYCEVSYSLELEVVERFRVGEVLLDIAFRPDFQ